MKLTAVFKEQEPNAVTVTTENSAGKGSQRVITPQQFIDILLNATDEEKALPRIGRIPEGFYDGYTDSRRGVHEAIMYIPAGVRPLLFIGSDEPLIVPFPVLVFYFRTKMGKVTVSKVFAAKDEKLTENTVLYSYPFGNVHDDGRICWGGNVLPDIKQLTDFEKLVEMFLGSETNNDLYRNVGGVTQEQLLAKLKGKKFFPNKWLVPINVMVRDL